MNSVSIVASKINNFFVSDQQPIQTINLPQNLTNDGVIMEVDEIDEIDELKIDQSNGFFQKIKYFIIFIFNLLIFFPNLLIFRPLYYFWYLITFPLRFLEERYGGSKDDDDLDDGEKLIDEFDNFESINSFKNKNYSKKLPSIPEPFDDNESSSSSKNMNLINKNIPTKSSLQVAAEYEDLATINSIVSNPSVITEINQLKSPTSPSSYMTAFFAKLPKVFFSPLNFNPIKHQKKTLILDLDETLIHSLSKTNRMSTAHMVEVKLNNNLASLYYVYKRPFCDEFLRLVSNWFEVYIFTASTKEYADPVINWLERDYKFFSKRFYREHCTLREGAGYIKDLSIINTDLSKAILIDNSPISYSLNYENAIDIEGWIDDPTDNELLQLLPLLNALRFVTDVRYILGMKNGEEAFKT